jgi:hypothetical protein
MPVCPVTLPATPTLGQVSDRFLPGVLGEGLFVLRGCLFDFRHAFLELGILTQGSRVCHEGQYRQARHRGKRLQGMTLALSNRMPIYPFFLRTEDIPGTFSNGRGDAVASVHALEKCVT